MHNAIALCIALSNIAMVPGTARVLSKVDERGNKRVLKKLLKLLARPNNYPNGIRSNLLIKKQDHKLNK